MVTCELCGKQVKTAQALRGHKTFIHGITGSNTQQPVARLATEQQVSLLEDRLQQLERVTGLRESDLDFSLSDTEPLTDRLTNITEQVTTLRDAVSKLSDIVSKLSEDVELAKADKVMVGELNHKLKEAHNSLAGVVNNHCDAFNKNFEVHRSKIDKVQKLVEGLGEGLNEIRTKLTTHGHDGLSLIPQLSSRLQQVGEEIAGLQAGVAKAQALAVRKPTDDFERLELANGSKHTFRVYKGKRGLSKPHRVSIDLFLGDKYVDLAEPEN
jgi:chromosome segregation ATPase